MRTAVARVLASMEGGWRRNLAAALVLTVFSLLAGAAGPLVVREALEGTSDVGEALSRAAVGYLVAALVGGIASGLLIDRMVLVGQEFLHRLRVEALDAVLRLGLLETQDRSGDLQSRVTNDVESLTDASVELVPSLMTAVLTMSGGVLAVAVLSPVGAVLTLLVVPPVVLLSRWLIRRGRAVYRAERERLGELSALLVESAEGAETLRGLRAAGFWRERVLASNHRVTEAIRAGTRMRNRYYPMLTAVNGVVFAVILLVVCLLANEGRVSTATAGALLLALGGVFAPVAGLAVQVDQVLTARASLTRVLELCATPAVGDRPPRPSSGDWSMRGLGFGYDPDTPVLTDISLTVGPAEHLALVGATGSGKSTLLRLATGLVSPLAGSSVGGSLLFPQRSVVVSGTLLDNVRLWCPHAKPADVRRAAAELGLAGWLDSLPEGLETVVGFGGVELDGPGRQRLALLGLVLIEAGPVAMDEPTGLLPPDEQRVVLEGLRRHFAGHPLIIASHHRVTAEAAVRVAFLAEGRLVDVGTHAELTERCADYRRLWTSSDFIEEGL